jgi:hypothetical protein
MIDKRNWPIPLAALSKAWVCGCSLAEIADANSAGDKLMSLSCEHCVLLGRSPCDRPIPRPDESYRVCVCVCVCVCVTECDQI